MKKIKSYFLAIFSVVMGLSTIGCKPYADGGYDLVQMGRTKIGVCLYSYDDPYISSVRGAIEAAAKTSNIELMMRDSKNNQETQNEQIDSMIQSGVQALAINLVDVAAASDAIEKARMVDIPIIFFNREPDMDILRSYNKARFVGTNPEEAGVIQGKIMLNIWENIDCDRNGDGKMQYVMLMGDPGSLGATSKTESSIYTVVRGGIVIEMVGGENSGSAGAKTTMADASVETFIRGGVGVEKIGESFANWDRDRARTEMVDWLANFGDKIEFVIANNDVMAAGAIAALQDAGYNKGDGGNYIPVFGVDATDEAVGLINRGFMSGTVKQDAEAMADAVLTLAKNAAEGRDFLNGSTKYEYDGSGIAIRIPYQAFMGEGSDPMLIDSSEIGQIVQQPDGQKIGVAMPTRTLQRWIQDGENMKKQLEAAGYTVDLQYANNEVPTQLSQIEAMINSECKVLVITPIDGEALGTVLAKAKAANIPVISYDRLILNSDAITFYASFDNYMVGTIQGEFLRDALNLDTVTGPFNIELVTGSPDDSNAKFFYNGAMDVLRPYIESGKLIVPSGQIDFEQVATQAWASDTAQARFTKIIADNYAAGKKLDAVLASNDSTALGVTRALLAAGYTKENFPLLTGQDCDIEAVKNMLAGFQSMSIFKDTRTLASKTVEMVDTIIKGTPVAINDTKTYDNGQGIVPSYLCSPVFATVNNYEELLIDSGYYEASLFR